MARWPAPLLVATASSCFDPRYIETRCSPAGECPSGFECRDDLCVTPQIDAASPDARLEIDASDAADPAPDARPCPGAYVDLGIAGSRYRLDFEKTWPDAEQLCENEGAGIHLALVDSAAEATALATLIDLSESAIWIGLSDRVSENDFVDVTGVRPTFLPWGPGEPSNTPPGEDCAELRADTFNDNECSRIHAFVCECDGKMPVPSAFLAPGPP